jgi:CRISPR/Cas system-associated protein Csm6
MKPFRQIEAVEMMVSANCFTRNYADMLLATTRPEHLVSAKKARNDVTLEEIERMQREMERLQEDYQSIENTLAESTLDLVVIKGYLTRLIQNKAIADYLGSKHKEWFDGLTKMLEDIAIDVQNPRRE